MDQGHGKNLRCNLEGRQDLPCVWGKKDSECLPGEFLYIYMQYQLFLPHLRNIYCTYLSLYHINASIGWIDGIFEG